MNKYNITTFYLLLLVSLISCDKDGILDEEITGYQTIETSFVFPADINKNYTYILNGDTLENGKGFLPRTETTGKLEVIEKGSTKPAYSGDIVLNGNQTVQFIKLGDKVDIYTPDTYTQFVLDVKWAQADNSSKYKTLFNGVEISTNPLNKNYVSKKELTGKLQIIKLDNNEVVTDKQITINPEETITLLQLGENLFLSLPPGEEKAPESDDFVKVRFYYTNTSELTENSYTMKLVAVDGWSGTLDGSVEIGSFEIKAGELTPYITVNGRLFETTTTFPVYFTYDLIAPNGTKIRERSASSNIYDFPRNWDVNYLKFTNKFETYNISEGGNLVLSEAW